MGHFLGGPLSGPGQFFGSAPQLVGGSWLNRPLTAGVFGGVLAADSLNDELEQDADFIAGVRFGWDFHDHWGAEMRFAAAAVDVQDPATSATIGEDDIFMWDTSVLYYPWGDSRWRPYLSLGLGFAHFDFLDAAGQSHQQGVFELPIGIGVKYRLRPWSALRFDLTDHIAFSGGALDTMQNVTFTFGIDYRFGGDRVMYWPWEPSTVLW
ncbi:MAG: outer membrane beta-barrel protein [Pirellulales bacterium]